MKPQELSSRIITALDTSSTEEAFRLVGCLPPEFRFFKVGLQLFTAAGPEIVRRLKAEGARIFLDLKLYDIPNTVAAAALEAARLGVDMMTLHAQGGLEMLQSARSRLEEAAGREGWPLPHLLGVTVLTSMDEATLTRLGINRSVEEFVLHLAQLVSRAGLSGLVCSPRELSLLRAASLQHLIFVTPGIRPAGADRHDQRRTMSPGRALEAGADFLVIGRPITRAPDPAAAAGRILAEMESVKMSPNE